MECRGKRGVKRDRGCVAAGESFPKAGSEPFSLTTALSTSLKFHPNYILPFIVILKGLWAISIFLWGTGTLIPGYANASSPFAHMN